MSAVVDSHRQRIQTVPDAQKPAALVALASAQEETVAAIKAYSTAIQPITKSATVTATEEPTVKAWTALHDTLYHALLTALSDDFRMMTLNCTTAVPETWKRLEAYLEGKAAADQRAAETQLNRAQRA